MIPIRDILSIPRTGPCIHEREALCELVRLAKRVSRSDEQNHWTAETAREAAAWLLCLAHWQASDDELDIPFENHFQRNSSVSYRGQRAEYDSLAPTFCRKSDDERQIHGIANRWMQVAVQLWHDSRFEYAIDDLPQSKVWFGIEETWVVSQHYGIWTQLLDWTYDPMVSLVFASEDQQGCVLLRHVKPRKESLILPPTFVRRLWKQKGVMEFRMCERYPSFRFSVPDQGVRQSPRILFSVDESERHALCEYRSLLMRDEEGLETLAGWSIRAAEKKSPPGSLCGSPTMEQLSQEVEDIPGIMTNGTKQVEDVEAMLQYYEMACLRKFDGKTFWDLQVLLSLVSAMGIDASLRRNPRKLRELGLSKGGMLTQAFRDPVGTRIAMESTGIRYVPMSVMTTRRDLGD